MRRAERSRTETVEDFMARLYADPEWVAMRARLDEQFAKEAAELSLAEAPLVEDLRSAGFDVDSVYDFVNTARPYREAVPILLEHFPMPYPPAIREGIARALGVRDARFAWETLKKWYEEEPERRAKEGLAVALSIIADKTVLDDVIALVRNPRHGESRLLLLSALTRTRDERAATTIVEMKDDPDLRLQIGDILRRKAKRAQNAR